MVYTLEEIKTFFHNFIDLGTHFGLRENESYSTLVAKAGFFYAFKSWIFIVFSSKIPRIFFKLKMCDKVLFNNYTLKQK